MRFLITTFLILLSYSSFSFENDQNDVENHPQSSFPQISIIADNQKIEYYASDSAATGNLKYKKEEKSLKDEIPLSGYIFAKEFVESFKFSNTLANKKTRDEFIKIFSENNPGKMIDFLISVNEKKRTAENDKEINLLQKLIDAKKTNDEASNTPYFSTGYIELKSPKNNNDRYFIKISDVNKTNLKLSADKTKIDLLKSITVYSFQNVLGSLNFGDIEKNSPEDLLYQKLEKLNLSICDQKCQNDLTKDLSLLALNVGKIVNFEVVGNSKIKDMDDFNKYVMAQQWCLLKNFSNACHAAEFNSEIENLSQNKIILELIKRHSTSSQLCQFLQK